MFLVLGSGLVHWLDHVGMKVRARHMNQMAVTFCIPEGGKRLGMVSQADCIACGT